jgi:hypothetical protein
LEEIEMVRKICKLKEKRKNGFLDEVVNPCGKKQSVYIYQGRKPGFSAKYVESGREIPGSSRNGDAYARKLAKKGHRKVTFRD